MTECPEAAERVKSVRSRCKKRLEKLAEGFSDDSAGLLSDMAAVYPAVRGLFALVKDFEAAYAAEKERRGVLDFSDLEHMAVRLLVGEDGGPTPLAKQWSARYDEIMVDEYQDTNAVQNAIFSAISQDGKNLFMVGDVKQSIYRFRLADPTIFLEKYRTFTPYETAEEGEPRRIILSKNFRSRTQVLEGANFIFRGIMSRAFGEMDYTADEALYPGASYPDGADYAVELDALDLASGGGDDEDESGEKTPRDLLEARFLAKRIKELKDGGFPVSDGEGGTRPAGYGDMVILVRSPNSVLHHYARALGERDIPWEADAGGDYFETTEVSVALSLLQIVDNPRQDVPLISVLRSPVYGFTADRLAVLRAASPDTDFYAALVKGAEEGGADCAAFLAELEDLRFRSGDRNSHQLLWQIYDRTNLLGIFGAMDEGEKRQGNLLALCELARQFEAAGHKGLFGFLTYLTRLRDNGNKLAAPQAAREGGGVRILSIHKSKGLEFPIVLLAGLTRRLNRDDMQRPILFHPQLGVGPKRLDTERMIEYPTLARRAVARQLEYEMMAEELRLLYVAMTRAKEKLILSCALTRGAADLRKLAEDAEYPVDPQVLSGCQSVGQWVLLPVLTRPDAVAIRRAADYPLPIAAADLGPDWDIRWVDGSDLLQPPERKAAVLPGRGEEKPGRDLTGVLTWQYPHAGDVEIPSKLTATQLKGRELDREAAQEAGQGIALPQGEPEESAAPAGKRAALRRPRFAEEEFGLTPSRALRALHLVMQYIDFERAGTQAQVKEEIARLVAGGLHHPRAGGGGGPGQNRGLLPVPAGPGADGVGVPAAGVQVLHPGARPPTTAPAPGRGSRCCSRAWWTAALRPWRASRWWTSRPTG